MAAYGSVELAGPVLKISDTERAEMLLEATRVRRLIYRRIGEASYA